MPNSDTNIVVHKALYMGDVNVFGWLVASFLKHPAAIIGEVFSMTMRSDTVKII